ncbi:MULTISPECIES: peptide chain release factor H [Providencia]|uniref:Putative peptide chain release factor H n=1 Tax=Providencia alcalifaciens DSM 30120 TaxID=520999 RepID=B6XD04_9GAMM|nr:peptide chain release factor H [Providencia alcalifaciens]ATG15845.1 peptide chain release factor H [Providencia alcalifaciens]EEB46694.1 putative peptide chain release factor H [Providencia alcalifaciens DSM 30120]MTC27039.1 peptide chain release factor H [Providencia alcalifaciens]CAG9430153.1 Peptide chain release factor 2 [Providencia alcalifaciens]CAG9433602.1 Peptide chain release factor 2 [Providencia alcalifaciens]
MILLQFSSAQGPEECCIAVENAFACFVKEAALLKVNTELLESCPSKQGLKSVLIALDGIHAEKMAERWSGTIQWQCQSPLRPRHKRKNWFISVMMFTPIQPLENSEIEYEFTQSQGAGGQHVNKTCSAVRAKHVATGISVKVQSERSQHANKKLAKELIHWKLCEYQSQQLNTLDKQRHLSHYQIERGNAALIFTGKEFKQMN